MKWRFCAFLLLLFGAAHQLHARKAPPVGLIDNVYKGPVVCKGNKPLIIRDDSIYGANPDDIKSGKKQLHEQYWYQFYNHFKGCQIVVGNLIIAHQHRVPFEEFRLNESIADIEIVTGYIYIYDVSLELNFSSLRMVYGNEVFKLPKDWSSTLPNAPAISANDPLRTAEHAIFVEKYTGKNLTMAELRYIKRGRFGFLDTPNACAFNPKLRHKNLDFHQFFDDRSVAAAPVNHVNSFTQCPANKIHCYRGNKTNEVIHCEHCFGEVEKDCQKLPKACPESCKDMNSCASRPKDNTQKCCAANSWGGCDFSTARPFYCKKDHFLVIEGEGPKANRTCEKECHGLVINGTSICLKETKVCPDYMFPFSGKYCAYDCPGGYEVDPIGNYELIDDKERADVKYAKYWSGKNMCKKCRSVFDNDLHDFRSDCGIQCVIPSNSLSFFTILNIYPNADSIADMDMKKFNEIFHNPAGIDYSNPFFGKKCRHIFGFLHIDQYSVGYPYSGRRLIPEHLKPLTYATGLYGNIRIENTEGYWFAEPFRNLLVIQKPIQGMLPVDQKEFYGADSAAVIVRYNSDLRTVDLQRLQYVWGDITVKYNPLYIPPVKDDKQNPKVFEHIKEAETVYAKRAKVVGEVVMHNGLNITRTGRKITYDSGCTDGAISYYYKRCVKCASGELRYFVDENHEYYARCKDEDTCDAATKHAQGDQHKHATPGGFFIAKRDGEQTCLRCSNTCGFSCKDTSAFQCFDPLAKPADESKLSCKGKKVDVFNMEACLTADKTEKCPGPFYDAGGECKRCDSSCKLCNGASNKYSWLGSNGDGCKTCSVVYSKYDAAANKYIATCASAGPEPRCPAGADCHYFTTNPLRDAWTNMKRPTSDEFNEYGEPLSS